LESPEVYSGNVKEVQKMDWMQNKQKILRILEERTSINSETGCWEYDGIHESGYGRIVIDHIPYYVHRISAVLFLGYKMEYSEYLHVLHLPICKAKNCWNFNHLYIGTSQQNADDKVRIGKGSQYSNITHCKNGHEFNKENTYIHTTSDGIVHRRCRECRNENQKRYLRKFVVVKDQAG
jgi:hypothetical protein